MTTLVEPAVHIYTLSHLVNARVGSWERKIREIEEGRRRAYSYYQPMREAIVAYCASGGNRREQIVSSMLLDARQRPHGRGQNPERDNLAAFETFETACYPKIGQFVRDLLRRPNGTGAHFEGVRLSGGPHLQVKDRNGEDRYIFLRASIWSEDDLRAYLELLGVIVEETFGDVPESVWHMDLRAGLVAKHRGSKKIRRNCSDAARHYARVFAPDV